MLPPRTVHLAAREDLLRHRDSARVHHVDPQVVEQLVLDQGLELPLVRELLARRERQVHLVPHELQGVRVNRADRVLEEIEPIGLERMPEIGGLRGTEHRVGVEDQVDRISESRAQQLGGSDRLDDRCLRIPVRQRMVAERSERSEAKRREPPLLPPERILEQLLGRGSCEVAVHACPLPGGAAQEVVDGHTEPLPLEFPERDVDPRDGAHDHLPGRPERAAHHLAPPMLDPRRVLPPSNSRKWSRIPSTPRPCPARLASPIPVRPSSVRTRTRITAKS